MALPPEPMPPRPVWFGYIAVDDVDAKPKELRQLAAALTGRRLHSVQGAGAAAARDDADGFDRLARVAQQRLREV